MELRLSCTNLSKWVMVYHYRDVTWTSCHLISPATHLFVQQFRATKKQDPSMWWGFTSQRASNAEYVSMPLCHNLLEAFKHGQSCPLITPSSMIPWGNEKKTPTDLSVKLIWHFFCEGKYGLKIVVLFSKQKTFWLTTECNFFKYALALHSRPSHFQTCLVEKCFLWEGNPEAYSVGFCLNSKLHIDVLAWDCVNISALVMEFAAVSHCMTKPSMP